MDIPYSVITIVLAAMAAFSRLGKLRHDLVAFRGMAAGIGLIAYFVGAVLSHVRVRDGKGVGPASFMLTISIAAVVLRVLAHKTGITG
jgi:hypothetical protein